MDDSYFYGILAIGTDMKLYTRANLDASWVKAPDKGGLVTGITIMHDGTIVGIGTDKKLYTRNNLDSSWVKAPDKGGLVTDIAIMHDCAILGIGTDQKLYKREDLNASWVKAPDKGGLVVGITIRKDGSILGIGTDLKLYTRTDLDSPWVKALDKGGLVTRVTIMPDGSILGIGTDQKLYTRKELDSSWEKAPDKGGAVEGVAVASFPIVTIEVSATEAVPHPPGLSDGNNRIGIGEGGDEDFTTDVTCGQIVQFVPGEDVTAIKTITEGPGSDIFLVNPVPPKFRGKIGSLPDDDTRDYTIFYTVKGHNDPSGNPVVFEQDPKLNMKR